MRPLNFHVRHEVTPERVWDVLVAIVDKYPIDHIVQADRQTGRLRQLGLVEKNYASPTAAGAQLYRIGLQKHAVALDLLHCLHYSLWQPYKPLENTLSWSYRTYCDILFERGEFFLDLTAREALTAELNNAILDFFGFQVKQTKKGSISLSTNSLAGIHHWLTALEPPAIEEEKFSRRPFCSPELLLMAIGSIAISTGVDLNADILLTPGNRSLICRICILQLEALDRVLDWTLSLYPALIQPGTRSGNYGRFIRLIKLPKLDDLLVEENYEPRGSESNP